MKRFDFVTYLLFALLCFPSSVAGQYGVKFSMYNYCLPLSIEGATIEGEYTYLSRALKTKTEEAFRLAGVEVVPLSEGESDSHLSIRTTELSERNHFSYEVVFLRIMVVDGEVGYATTSRAGSTTQSFSSRDEVMAFYDRFSLPAIVDGYLQANEECDDG